MNRFFNGKAVEILFAVALTLAGLAILSSRWTGASEPAAENIVAGEAWARPTIGKSTTSAVYLRVTSKGRSSDTLKSVRTPICENAEIHETTNEGGVMRMRHLKDGALVPASGELKFAPGGHHIMLLGLKKPLEKGQTFPLTLTFEKAGEIEIPVTVTMTPATQSEHRGSHH